MAKICCCYYILTKSPCTYNCQFNMDLIYSLILAITLFPYKNVALYFKQYWYFFIFRHTKKKSADFPTNQTTVFKTQ